MSMSISDQGLAFIKKFEGCLLKAYEDAVGVWTIGYGHTSGVFKGQVITKEKAEEYLKSDCKNAEKGVNQYNHLYHFNQNQFDALVSFTFNCGVGNLKTLLQNGQRSISEISAKLPAYHKAGGKALQGLIQRRMEEKELFDRPIASPSSFSPLPQVVKPVLYLQTDPQWKHYNYSAKGEKKTIGSSGCGVVVAAMIIATLKDKSVTPITTAEWSMANGYKAIHQGTYYSYFVPQLKKYGISCKQLNQRNLYGQSSSSAHTLALQTLKKGHWVIACMGKGNWTNAGHFILLYEYENGYISIHDPASTAPGRQKNTWDLFSKQVKYMWAVDLPNPLTSPSPSPWETLSQNFTDFLGKVHTNQGNLNIRSEPNSSASIVGSYKKGELVEILGNTSTHWYKTKKGYVYGEYIVPARGKVYNCVALNIRKEPKVEEKNILSVLHLDEEVELLKEVNGWFKIKTKSQQAGYISGKYLALL